MYLYHVLPIFVKSLFFNYSWRNTETNELSSQKHDTDLLMYERNSRKHVLCVLLLLFIATSLLNFEM